MYRKKDAMKYCAERGREACGEKGGGTKIYYVVMVRLSGLIIGVVWSILDDPP